MTQNSIADGLIYGKTTTSGNEEKKETSMVDGRVASTKYKIYTLFFLLLGALLFSQFLIPAYNSNKKFKSTLASVQFKVDDFENQKALAEKNVIFLKTLTEKEKDILECINSKNKCEQFSGENLILMKDYLSLNSLKNDKMVIDEKKILENLNDFLLRKDINKSTYNGEIEAIHIGEEDVAVKTKNIADKIFYSPVDLTISFDNKDDLLSFVDNIEARILPKKESRILYQIENIKYDILKNQEKQSVDIMLYMFYTR